MDLLLLAPDIQEAVLMLPMVVGGADPVALRELLGVARVVEWGGEQRRRWGAS